MNSPLSFFNKRRPFVLETMISKHITACVDVSWNDPENCAPCLKSKKRKKGKCKDKNDEAREEHENKQANNKSNPSMALLIHRKE